MDKYRQISAFRLLKWLHWLIPVVLVITIKTFSYFPDWVENIYSLQLYPFISRIQRQLFGWATISIGDLIYGLFIIYLLSLLGSTLLIVVTNNFSWKNFRTNSLNSIKTLLWLYIIFNVLWGLN